MIHSFGVKLLKRESCSMGNLPAADSGETQA
jgi:hypothetical protein